MHRLRLPWQTEYEAVRQRYLGQAKAEKVSQ